MRDRADLIKIYLGSGYKSLQQMKNHYNKFDGESTESNQMNIASQDNTYVNQYIPELPIEIQNKIYTTRRYANNPIDVNTLTFLKEDGSTFTRGKDDYRIKEDVKKYPVVTNENYTPISNPGAVAASKGMDDFINHPLTQLYMSALPLPIVGFASSGASAAAIGDIAKVISKATKPITKPIKESIQARFAKAFYNKLEPAGYDSALIPKGKMSQFIDSLKDVVSFAEKEGDAWYKHIDLSDSKKLQELEESISRQFDMTIPEFIYARDQSYRQFLNLPNTNETRATLRDYLRQQNYWTDASSLPAESMYIPRADGKSFSYNPDYFTKTVVNENGTIRKVDRISKQIDEFKSFENKIINEEDPIKVKDMLTSSGGYIEQHLPTKVGDNLFEVKVKDIWDVHPFRDAKRGGPAQWMSELWGVTPDEWNNTMTGVIGDIRNWDPIQTLAGATPVNLEHNIMVKNYQGYDPYRNYAKTQATENRYNRKLDEFNTRHNDLTDKKIRLEKQFKFDSNGIPIQDETWHNWTNVYDEMEDNWKAQQKLGSEFNEFHRNLNRKDNMIILNNGKSFRLGGILKRY